MIDFTQYADSAAVTGAVGGLVRWVTYREPVSQLLRGLLSSVALAHYTAPMIAPFALAYMGGVLAATQDSARATTLGTAFLIGFFAVSLLVLVEELLKKWRMPAQPPAPPNDGG